MFFAGQLKKVSARLPDRATTAAPETNKAAILCYQPGHSEHSLKLEPPLQPPLPPPPD